MTRKSRNPDDGVSPLHHDIVAAAIVRDDVVLLCHRHRAELDGLHLADPGVAIACLRALEINRSGRR